MRIFLYFSSKPYVVTPHLNCLEKIQLRGHKICFLCRINNKSTACGCQRSAVAAFRSSAVAAFRKF